MGWIRTAYYGSRAEMESGIGRLAAGGWLVQSVTALSGGSYEVVFAEPTYAARKLAVAPGGVRRRMRQWGKPQAWRREG